jgi:hypothetical protein
MSQPLNVTIDPNDLSPDLKYVRALYTQDLNRPGSVPEWTFWAQFLNMPNGRFIVANALSRNNEAWTLVVKGWYSTYIGRAAVGGEEQFWVNLIARGFTEEQVLANFLSVPGYYARTPTILGLPNGTPPTDTTYVQALFMQLLGRAASQQELNALVPRVSQVGRAVVAYQLLTSVEYRAIQVDQFYANLLNRPNPSLPELLFWANGGLDLQSVSIFFASTSTAYFVDTGFFPAM